MFEVKVINCTPFREPSSSVIIGAEVSTTGTLSAKDATGAKTEPGTDATAGTADTQEASTISVSRTGGLSADTASRTAT
jgi:hypothetical protein